MPSYTQYKRQMAVMDADDANIETWITVKGNHIPIMKGQSKEEAVQSFLEKKGKSSGGAKKEPAHSSGSYTKVKGASQSGGVPDKVAERHIITVKEKPVDKTGTGFVKINRHSNKATPNKVTYKELYEGIKAGKTIPDMTGIPSDSDDEMDILMDLQDAMGFSNEEFNKLYDKHKSNFSSGEVPGFRELKGTKHQGGTIGLSKEEHNRIEKYNKWASKFDDQYKGDKAAFAKTQKILEGKGTREETERMVKSIEKTLGKEAGAKARENFASILKPDIEKPRSTTVVSKGSGKPKYKVGDVTKQGKIKEVIPARLSDTPYYKLENGKTYLEEELGAKPANSFSKEDIDFVKRNGVTQKYVEYQDEHEGLRNEIVMEERRGRKEDADKIREERKKLEAKMTEEVKRIKQIKELLSKSDNSTESERYNRPVHIGEAVRNVVKKMGEQRAESKKPTTGSSSGWPESPKFEKLTEKYMPKSGAADNELGEALRSINQAVYRYYNDGDMYNKGYGKETVNAAIKHLTQLSKNKATPRHIARGIDNGLYELKTYGVKDKGRYETALKILLQTFEFADEKDIDALSKMKRNNG